VSWFLFLIIVSKTSKRHFVNYVSEASAMIVFLLYVEALKQRSLQRETQPYSQKFK
jgi:hypothetical protein